MLAILQKSGMVHALYADTMQKAWEVQLGSNSVLTATGGNFGRTATDGQHLYVAANPGVLWSLATDDGRVEWATPLTFPIQGGNVALAGGVVYHVDTTGGRGWDAATGMPVWQGTLQPCDNTPSAISVARHTVIVNCAGAISAYQLAPA
jgi:outer membrane protein assembly factor BamB